MIYPRIIDSWRGGSNVSRQYYYQLVETSPQCYKVEVSLDAIDFTTIPEHSSAHSVARKIGDILREERQQLDLRYNRRIS